MRLSQAGALLGQQVPLSWVIDPDLLDSAAEMSRPAGYRVVSGDGTKPGTGTQSATDWLDPGQDGDGDQRGRRAALRRSRHHGAASGRAQLRRGERPRDRHERGDDRPRPAGHRPTWPGRSTATPTGRPWRCWPAPGRRPWSSTTGRCPPRLELNYTPGGRSDVRTSSGTVTALLADHVLTGLLAHAADNPVIAAQRFLAETAMITAELPSGGAGRVILIAPPRRWDPPQEFLDRLVAGTSAASWMTGTALSGMRTAPPAEVERRGVHYPAAERKHELSAPYLTALRSQHSRISIFAAVLTKPELIVPDLDTGCCDSSRPGGATGRRTGSTATTANSPTWPTSSARSTCNPAATPSAATAARSR